MRLPTQSNDLFTQLDLVLLSDLDQCCQLRPGLPELLSLREDIPAGWTRLEPEGEAAVRELASGGQQELGVRQQEVHLQA